jgi:D-3-phosphoglycerate dehydrogenase
MSGVSGSADSLAVNVSGDMYKDNRRDRRKALRGSAEVKLVIAEPEAYGRQAVQVLNTVGRVVSVSNRDELLSEIKDADALLVGVRIHVGRQLLETAQKLAVIGSPTTGVDHIDVDFAASRNISVVTLRGHAEILVELHATVEHAIALMLSLVRRIPWAFFDVRSGSWQRYRFKGVELHGKTLGVIGFGRIGRGVAHIADAMGMKVLVYDTATGLKRSRGATPVPLMTLLRRSDIVSVHVPLDQTTEGLLSRRRIHAMKKGAFLINTARGRLVDEAALLDALKTNHLAGAALDVIAKEFTEDPTSNPLVEYAIRHENLLITPHIGGATVESLHKSSVFIAKTICDMFKGKRC